MNLNTRGEVRVAGTSDATSPANDVPSGGLNTVVRDLVFLFLKTVVVVLAIGMAISYFLPDSDQFLDAFYYKSNKLKGDVKAALRDETVRVRLRGLLTQNPAVHWTEADILEQRGDLATAAQEIQFAIGLLELHSADKAVLQRYQQRLKDLQARLAKQSTN